MNLIIEISQTIAATVRDIAPIVLVLLGFQLGLLRKRIPHLKQVLFGLAYVVLGLAFFLFGLEKALFPLGKEMARQLTDPDFIRAGVTGPLHWYHYYWTYIFAFAIGFATTIAEPSLIAVAMKAR